LALWRIAASCRLDWHPTTRRAAQASVCLSTVGTWLCIIGLAAACDVHMNGIAQLTQAAHRCSATVTFQDTHMLQSMSPGSNPTAVTLPVTAAVL
jgi:hypothetical protein